MEKISIKDALAKAKNLQSNQTRESVHIVYKNYKGYDVVSEPVELTIIKNSLGMMNTSKLGFKKRVGHKYG